MTSTFDKARGSAWQGVARRGSAQPGVAGQGKGSPFTPSRPDGRSDRRVIFELAQDTEPGTAFSFDELVAALSEGLDVEVGRERVTAAVSQANRTLLRERRRYLGNVRAQGYRVIAANEHLPVALAKKDRAETYMKRGIELLRNVRTDELSATERTLHEGQLLILGGLYQATRESSRRHDKSEALISELQQRIEKLEQDA